MKIEFDTEKDDMTVLKHIRCILDQVIENAIGELTLPSKLKVPMEIFSEIEMKVGKIVPLLDFYDALANKQFKKKEAFEIIDNLKKEGLIFEPKSGFVKRI